MTAVLEARGLVFAYPDGPVVLDGADLAVDPGRRLAVLGPNGGGKTTLFRLLLGLLAPAAGEVLLDGEPVRRTRRGLVRLRESAQLVLQDPDDQLFSADVAQDVSFGPLNLGLDGAEVDARVHDALAAVGIADLADRPTHRLSFGQRKRVAIAGALAVRPRVLVLDEPTAGLDPAGVEELVVVLEDLQRAGTAVVLSTHDVDLAHRWADDVAVVARGGCGGSGGRDPRRRRAARGRPARPGLGTGRRAAARAGGPPGTTPPRRRSCTRSCRDLRPGRHRREGEVHDRPEPAPVPVDEIDLTLPNPARVYDYMLGGGHNFATDREFAERLLVALPDTRELALANRAFLGRAVRACLDRGCASSSTSAPASPPPSRCTRSSTAPTRRRASPTSTSSRCRSR